MSYCKAVDVAEAVALHSATEGSAYLAGGQTLLAAVNRRERACTQLIDVRHISDLRKIEWDSAGLSLGAAVTLNELLCNDRVLAAMPVLAVALRHVGNHTVRNCSTVGGHVALADGWSEVNLVLRAAGAIVTTNLRSAPIEALIAGHRASGLRGSELIQSVQITHAALADRYGFCEFTLRASGGRAIVAAVVRRDKSAVLAGVTPNQIVLEGDAILNAPEFLEPLDYRGRLGIEALQRAARDA